MQYLQVAQILEWLIKMWLDSELVELALITIWGKHIPMQLTQMLN
jgi:hypothetical protein